LAQTEVIARFPPKLEFLFKPARYKVAYGGRGGTKSWGFARALLIQAAERKLRILCAREVQKSIKDSVHQLLTDQIDALGLGHAYQILTTEIRGSNGSQFLFSGLSDLTAESIKSFEGVDIVWVEEARAVTKRSWSILIPTIRKDGSEIWISFNPELDTDETYSRFVTNPPPDAVVVKLTYRDNPWFPEVLEKERLHSMTSDPVNYPNIWEGECKAAVDGAIYATEVSQMQQTGRVCPVPYDPMLKVHIVCDLGFNDAMVFGLVQSNSREIRLIDYLEDSHRTIDSYSAELRDKKLNWGKLWLPHDAKHKTLVGGGRSVRDMFNALGWETDLVPDVGIEFGIKKARMMLARTYVDKTKCVRLMECLKRYRRGIPMTTGEPGAPIHDEFSHGADMVRYLAVIHEQLKNEERWGKALSYDNRGIV
jgi:phage terminase large subunit